MDTLWHDWLHSLQIVEFSQRNGLLALEDSTPCQWLGGDAVLCGNGSQMASSENVILYSTRPVHGYRNALRLCNVGSPALLPGRMLVT